MNVFSLLKVSKVQNKFYSLCYERNIQRSGIKRTSIFANILNSEFQIRRSLFYYNIRPRMTENNERFNWSRLYTTYISRAFGLRKDKEERQSDDDIQIFKQKNRGYGVDSFLSKEIQMLIKLLDKLKQTHNTLEEQSKFITPEVILALITVLVQYQGKFQNSHSLLQKLDVSTAIRDGVIVPVNVSSPNSSYRDCDDRTQVPLKISNEKFLYYASISNAVYSLTLNELQQEFDVINKMKNKSVISRKKMFKKLISKSTKYSRGQNSYLEMKHFQLGTIDNIPSYIVFLDHDDQMIVIGIRGTAELADALINVHMVPQQINSFGSDAYAHEGIYTAAESLLDHLNSQIDQLVKDYPTYSIKTTGHSLGGAISAILSIRLRTMYSNHTVESFGFSTPACLSRDIAEANSNFITTLVVGDDIIPRFCTKNLLRFRHALFETEHRKELSNISYELFEANLKPSLKGIQSSVDKVMKQITYKVDDAGRTAIDGTHEAIDVVRGTILDGTKIQIQQISNLGKNIKEATDLRIVQPIDTAIKKINTVSAILESKLPQKLNDRLDNSIKSLELLRQSAKQKTDSVLKVRPQMKNSDVDETKDDNRRNKSNFDEDRRQLHLSFSDDSRNEEITNVENILKALKNNKNIYKFTEQESIILDETVQVLEQIERSLSNSWKNYGSRVSDTKTHLKMSLSAGIHESIDSSFTKVSNTAKNIMKEYTTNNIFVSTVKSSIDSTSASLNTWKDSTKSTIHRSVDKVVSRGEKLNLSLTKYLKSENSNEQAFTMTKRKTIEGVQNFFSRKRQKLPANESKKHNRDDILIDRHETESQREKGYVGKCGPKAIISFNNTKEQESEEMQEMMENDLNVLNIMDYLKNKPNADIALYPPGKIYWLSVRDHKEINSSNVQVANEMSGKAPTLYELQSYSFFDQVLLSPYIVQDHSIDGIVEHLKGLLNNSSD